MFQGYLRQFEDAGQRPPRLEAVTLRRPPPGSNAGHLTITDNPLFHSPIGELYPQRSLPSPNMEQKNACLAGSYPSTKTL